MLSGSNHSGCPMSKSKKYADPVKVLYIEKDEGIEQFAGVLYRWNTGQVQMRWDIDPAALGGMFSIRWEGLAGHA